jgi:2-methylcitrate dehydratase
MVAVVLLKGHLIETADYMDDSPRASDARVDILRDSMVVLEDDEFTRDYHDQKVRSGANGIKIKLKNGDEIPEVVVEFLVGHPKRKDTLEKVHDKFRLNIEREGFSDSKVDKIIREIENDNLLVYQFVDLFVEKLSLERKPIEI